MRWEEGTEDGGEWKSGKEEDRGDGVIALIKIAREKHRGKQSK